MAEALGFRDVTIAAVGMDHCKAACPEFVVDAFIHLDRCMLKNQDKLNRPDNISTARTY
jgi:hypothetical protein